MKSLSHLHPRATRSIPRIWKRRHRTSTTTCQSTHNNSSAHRPWQRRQLVNNGRSPDNVVLGGQWPTWSTISWNRRKVSDQTWPSEQVVTYFSTRQRQKSAVDRRRLRKVHRISLWIRVTSYRLKFYTQEDWKRPRQAILETNRLETFCRRRQKNFSPNRITCGPLRRPYRKRIQRQTTAPPGGPRFLNSTTITTISLQPPTGVQPFRLLRSDAYQAQTERSQTTTRKTDFYDLRTEMATLYGVVRSEPEADGDRAWTGSTQREMPSK